MGQTPELDPSHDLDVSDGVATLRAGDALLTLWSAAASVARIRRVNHHATELIRRAPAGIVAVQILMAKASPPGLGEVSEVRAGMREIAPHARRLIAVPLGDAGWQTVVRGVMRAGVRLIGQADRVKIAGSTAEALDWVAEASTAHTPERTALERALEALFGGLGEPMPGLRGGP